MSRHITFIVPGSIETRTGGYEYDRRMIAALRTRGWTVDICELDRHDALPEVADESIVVVDGLALDSAGAALEREAARLRVVALVHMPGASRTDERAPLVAARSIVVSGGSAKRALIEDGVEAARITIVEPGTVSAPIARGSLRLASLAQGGPGAHAVHLLCVATLNALKGHEILLTALTMIPERNWRLTCAGSLSRDPGTAARVRRMIVDWRLDDRVTLAGESDERALAARYDSADVFVLATLSETYGMAVAEAIARGLPVISTATGEIPRIVGDGGIIVPPGDVDAFAAALSSVLRDAKLRERLRDGAKRARLHLRTWDQAGDEMAAALGRVTSNA